MNAIQAQSVSPSGCFQQLYFVVLDSTVMELSVLLTPPPEARQIG